MRRLVAAVGAAARRRRRWSPALNRFTWDLRYAPATSFPGHGSVGRIGDRPGGAARNVSGAPDGERQALTQPLVVKRHPLRSATDADLKEQFDLAIQIRDKVSEANNAVIQIREHEGSGEGSPRQVPGRGAEVGRPTS